MEVLDCFLAAFFVVDGNLRGFVRVFRTERDYAMALC